MWSSEELEAGLSSLLDDPERMLVVNSEQER